MIKKALVCGAGGFIGSHLVDSLKQQGYYVVGADLHLPEFSVSTADRFELGDLSQQKFVETIFDTEFDEVYQLAADMGGAGYVFTGNNDANIMSNSALINLNVLRTMQNRGLNKVFYSSSACMYPENLQDRVDSQSLRESDAYPANPDSEYGWEKLFSERLYLSYYRNYGFDVRIARFHNVFGPMGSWNNGKEKAPAALCRKVAETPSGGTIDVWGTGLQVRSFLYIDECIEGINRLMSSNYPEPLNLGSDRSISINDLVTMISNIAGKDIKVNNIPGPTGVATRNSNNDLIWEVLAWRPNNNLEYGVEQTYKWIEQQQKIAEHSIKHDSN